MTASPVAIEPYAAYNAGPISVSASGDNAGIAGVAGQTTRVFALALTAASPVDIVFRNGASTLGVFQGVTSIVLDPFANGPRWVMNAAATFVISLSSGVAVKGTVWYQQA